MAATWHSTGASIHIMIEFRAGNYANYSRAGWRWFTLLSALLCALDAEAGQAAVPLASDAEARVAALTNDLRSKQGLPPVEIEPRLTAAARAFAAYVARTDKLDHDADGSTPAARAEKSGYRYCVIAENIAYEYDSGGFTADNLSRNIVRGWSESQTHRANMLHADVTHVGIGIVSGKTGEYYAVQMLGRPLAQAVKFRVVNRTSTTVKYDYRDRAVTLAPLQTRTHQSCVNGVLRRESLGQNSPAAVRPRDGGVYAVTQSGNGFRLGEE